MIPYQGTNTQSCGPIPSTAGGVAPSGPQWSSRWGAIASDATTGVLGAVDRRENKRAASKDAVSECKSRGGDKCKVEFTYRDQCVVTIAGDTGSNHGHAESVELATQLGMDACAKRGDTNCHVYYQACSLPVRVR
ncbi:DUF4189 domain-containing protein [Lysobacter gummosus]